MFRTLRTYRLLIRLDEGRKDNAIFPTSLNSSHLLLMLVTHAAPAGAQTLQSDHVQFIEILVSSAASQQMFSYSICPLTTATPLLYNPIGAFSAYSWEGWI